MSSSRMLKLGETSIKQVQFSRSKKDKRLRQNSRTISVNELPRAHVPLQPPPAQPQIYSLPSQDQLQVTTGSLDDVSSIANYYSSSSGDAQPMDQDNHGIDTSPRIDHFIGLQAKSNTQSRKQTKTIPPTPIEDWLTYRRSYLNELLILEGPGAIQDNSNCSYCGVSCSICDFYRCLDCRRVDPQCKRCTLTAHVRHPFHRIQWSGSFWKQTSLEVLGLVYQLGHSQGECQSPKRATAFSILHTNGFHKLMFSLCGCSSVTRLGIPHAQLISDRLYPASSKAPATAFTFEVLDLYIEASSHGKISLQHFYQSMSRLTDNTELDLPIKKRYDEFGHAVRCYRHLLMLKRGGAGHQLANLTSTALGRLAIECPACPQPGRNLTPGWEQSAHSQKHKYGLYLGMDANFKLKRWKRGNGRDQELGPGWAYFADHNALRRELARVEAEAPPAEPVVCESQHSAVENANSPANERCDCTGVAGVVCTRHGLIRPQGLTDLQAGERQVNMDFVFLSAIFNTTLMYIFLSYDITCQWSIHLLRRGKLFPSLLAAILERIVLTFGIPKFHLPAHGSKCRSKFSLNFVDSWARVDGEGIERVWAFLNGFGPASREMARGARHDFLDYQIGSMNFRKVVELGKNLLDQIEDADESIAIHKKAFEDLRLACNAADPGITDQWDKMIASWQQDHDIKPDPYQDDDTIGKSNLNHVKTALLEEELSDLRSISITNTTGKPGRTESTFIAEGLELQEAQLAIRAMARQNQHSLGKTELLRFKKSQVTLLCRIMKWIAVQDRFMPGIMTYRLEKVARTGSTLQRTDSALVAEDEELSDDENEPVIETGDEDDDGEVTANSLGLGTKPEDIELLLPSSLPLSLRLRCSKTLQEKELKLRLALMEGELYQIRRLLQIKSAVFLNKKANIGGQRDSTRSNQTLKSFEKRIRLHVQYYRASWEAAGNLLPDGAWSSRYQQLADADARAYNQDDADELMVSDSDSDAALGSDNEDMLPRRRVRTRKRRRKRRKVASIGAQQIIEAIGEGHRVISWIWRMTSASLAESAPTESRQTLQTEYAKSKARLERWVEERELVIEEMRRVPWFMQHKAIWWENLLGADERQPAILHFGLKAYAAKQANMHRKLAKAFMDLWKDSSSLKDIQIDWPSLG